MNQKNKTRNHLMAVYARLSPLEQALIQLCSIIYEPVDATTVIKCFQQTGLTFPENRVRNSNELESYLDRLQILKLLNRRFQCAEAIVEVCSRAAVNTQVGLESSAKRPSGGTFEVRARASAGGDPAG